MTTAYSAKRNSLMQASTQAFGVQYTSIILIILNFIIGTFAAQQIKDAAKNTSVVNKAISNETQVKQPHYAGILEFNDLFADSGTELDGDKLFALREFLKNHDVNVEVDVTSVGMGSEALDFDLALARSVSLSRHLLAEGIPASAFKIFAAENRNSSAQAKFRISMQ